MFKTMTAALNRSARPTEQDINKIPSFIMCRWLSNNPATIQAANIFNYYYKEIPVVQQWQMIHSSFAGKIKYIQYPKIEKDEESRDLKILQRHYNISVQDSKDYRSLLPEEEMQKLRTKYERVL